jgi:hypothetical protein
MLDPDDVLSLCGWRDDPIRHVIAAQYPRLSAVAPHLYGAAPPGDIQLYRAWSDVLGHYPPYVAQEIGDCAAPGTIVWGETIKPVEQVQVGDRVWTGEGKLTRVISTRTLETHRPLVKIHALGSWPLTFTADHKFLVYRMSRVGGKRVTAHLYERETRKRSLRVSEKERQRALQCYEQRSPQWVAALSRPSEFPGNLWTTPSGRWLLGYFLGYGHANGGSVEFAVNDTEIEAELVAFLERHGFGPKVDFYRSGCPARRVRVLSRELVGWLRTHFYDANSVKVFPSWAVGDADFLYGLQQADGNVAKSRQVIDSTSLSIVNGACASLVVLGYDPVVNNSVRSGGEYPNAKPIYRVSWVEDKQRNLTWRDESFLCRPVRRVEFLEGTSVVHDIGVADPHHSFLAEGHASHNCTSWGAGHAVDLLAAVQIVLGHRAESWKETCTEALYGAGREIANMLGPPGERGDGCVGSALAQAVSTVGTVAREVVGPYSGKRAGDWGWHGTPQDVKRQSHDHLVQTVALVKIWDELRAALGNGYPVTVASDQGFDMTRNSLGICEAKGTWPHQMMICGILYTGTRDECAVIGNSWGDSAFQGPTPEGIPKFSFAARRRVVEKMLGQGDSWTFSSFQGYPGQPLPGAWSYSSYI